MRKKKRFLNKIRFKTLIRGSWKGYPVYVCENCRIKDGLGTTALTFATCSYCGRKTRCYYYSRSNNWAKTVARPNKHLSYWYRGKTLWKDHSLGRKK